MRRCRRPSLAAGEVSPLAGRTSGGLREGSVPELNTGLANRKESVMSTITTDRRPARPVPPTTETPVQRTVRVVAVWLTAHSITALRVSLGLVILGFGALKFIPGASPAEDLAIRTTDVLTLGLVSGTVAVVATAVLETFIGITLLTGIGLRAGLIAMTGWLVGIMT